MLVDPFDALADPAADGDQPGSDGRIPVEACDPGVADATGRRGQELSPASSKVDAPKGVIHLNAGVPAKDGALTDVSESTIGQGDGSEVAQKTTVAILGNADLSKVGSIGPKPPEAAVSKGRVGIGSVVRDEPVILEPGETEDLPGRQADGYWSKIEHRRR